jgi:competence protein ComK
MNMAVSVQPYVVSETTMAIIPEYSEKGVVKIFDVLGIYYENVKPIQLLNQACMARGSSYDGRIQAVRNRLNYFRKTPLMICPNECIFTFPTKSHIEHDCYWIFPRHIQQICHFEGIPIIQFQNGEQLMLNCSIFTLHRQIERTANCMFHFSKPPSLQIFYLPPKPLGRT